VVTTSETFNNPLRSIQADATVDVFDGGSLLIGKGTKPAANTAHTGADVLVTITLPTPCFAAAVDGVASKAGAWSATAIAAGTATWARFLSADTLKWHTIDVAITGTGGTTDLELDNPVIAVGQTVTISTYTYTAPAS
jgi:hypothetical protein